MDKWQYLTLEGTSLIIIETNLPMAEFTAAFPNDRVNSQRKGEITIAYKGNLADIIAFKMSVLDYLGSQGWEAYAIYEKMYYFRRKV